VTRRLSISCAIIPAQIASASYAWSRCCGPGITHPSAWRGYYGHTRRYGPKLDAAHDLMALLKFSLACSMHEAGVQAWKGPFRPSGPTTYAPSGHPSVDPPPEIARACVPTRPHFALDRPRARGCSGAAAASPLRLARWLRSTRACCWWHRRCRGDALKARLTSPAADYRRLQVGGTPVRPVEDSVSNVRLAASATTHRLRLQAWFARWLQRPHVQQLLLAPAL
jgi:hypothetical protein